eukprot:scaffold6776_cov99-Skeletonema_dohrnii-CCMP3373.AAC.8
MSSEEEILGWKSFKFKVLSFEYLHTTKGYRLETPEFHCRGDEWILKIYPGGNHYATNGYLSVYLDYHANGAISEQKSSLKFEIKILDKFGATKKAMQATIPQRRFQTPTTDISRGFSDFILLSDILDESQNFIDEALGSLTIVVSIKDPPTAAFVPKNPFQDMMQNKFLDEESSDVCFEVSMAEANEDNTNRARSLIPFHAHRLILEICAPMLAELFGEGESAVVTVNDIKPDVFHQLLWYVYGGTVPVAPLKECAKDIIDAADKYSIVNLKLEAEAAYVESTTITADNAMDNLLYADAKNLAVLKEAVMDFLAAHGGEVIGNVSFAQFPPQLVSDLLVATTRRNDGDSGRDDDFTTMRVSELRRKLHEKGLGMNVDGSREAMIEALRRGAAER